jgi:SpoVK/Ycf46/Vps4 family AAA+-type ATPase
MSHVLRAVEELFGLGDKNRYPIMYSPNLVDTRKISGFATDLTNIGKQYVMDSVKTKFGKEFKLNTNRPIIMEGVKKFFAKYDPNFAEHFTIDDKNGRDKLAEFINVMKWNGRSDTRMIVATYHFTDYFIPLIDTNKERYDDYEIPTMYLYIVGKKAFAAAKELEDLITVHDNPTTSNKKLDKMTFYTVNTITNDKVDISSIDIKTREMDTLFFSKDESKKVLKHLEQFKSLKDTYTEKGLLYKTGILLYGNPGTGKSSLAKAIATECKRYIISINLSKIDEIDFSTLTSMIVNDVDYNYVILLEDIDTLFLNREEKIANKDYNNIINKLLQFLDSNSSPTNVIFIATTNYIDKLDKAILREGRFDLKLKVEELIEDDAYKFCESFKFDKDTCNKILEEYSETTDTPRYDEDGNFLYNQSKLQNIILQYTMKSALSTNVDEDIAEAEAEEESNDKLAVSDNRASATKE